MQTISDEKVIHTMAATHPSIATIVPGQKARIETRSPGIPDEVFARDYSDGNYPARILSITGPLYVEGAKAGDVLAVTIHDIELKEQGKMWMGQWMGILMDEVKKPYLKKVEVRDGLVHFTDKLNFPVNPMVGTIGVAPVEEIACLYPGTHGGNMDTLSVAPGSTVYLPVTTDGALLAIGDVHAAMGEGEIFGTGIEIGSFVTISVAVRQDMKIKHPLIETETAYEVVVSADDMLEACKEATRVMIAFIQEKTALPFEEAYALAGQCAHLRISQAVNPIVTVRFEISKTILNALA